MKFIRDTAAVIIVLIGFVLALNGLLEINDHFHFFNILGVKGVVVK